MPIRNQILAVGLGVGGFLNSLPISEIESFNKKVLNLVSKYKIFKPYFLSSDKSNPTYYVKSSVQLLSLIKS